MTDTPPHRVEWSVTPSLPKCNEYDAFYGIITNWVTIESIDQTAKRKLVVTIKRLPDGGKKVDLSVLDPDGAEVGGESHLYRPTEECFRVLYWTAFDAAKLLRATIPPPEEEPPMSVDKLVADAEKPDDVQKKPQGDQVKPPSGEPTSTPTCKPYETAQDIRPRWHLVAGTGASVGLMPVVMPGFRIGVGRSMGPFMFEFDARAFPPVFDPKETNDKEPPKYSAHAYLGSLAMCARRAPLLGCFVATGGAAGYLYDEADYDAEGFVREPMRGVFGLGVRSGAEVPLSLRWTLRFDVEGTLMISKDSADVRVGPVLTGFVSFGPSF